MPLNDSKYCEICKTEKPGHEFFQSRNPYSANYHVCRECRRYKTKAYIRKIGGWHARYVYLIDGGNGLYKIGIALDMERRFQGIQCMSPVPLTLMLTTIVVEGVAFETRIHSQFAEVREHGEWFRLTQEQLQVAIDMIKAAELPAERYQPLR